MWNEKRTYWEKYAKYFELVNKHIGSSFFIMSTACNIETMLFDNFDENEGPATVCAFLYFPDNTKQETSFIVSHPFWNYWTGTIVLISSDQFKNEPRIGGEIYYKVRKSCTCLDFRNFTIVNIIYKHVTRPAPCINEKKFDHRRYQRRDNEVPIPFLYCPSRKCKPRTRIGIFLIFQPFSKACIHQYRKKRKRENESS